MPEGAADAERADTGIAVALPGIMIDDRVTRRRVRASSRRREAERETEQKALAKEPGRPRRTAQNKPERRRNYRFKESVS